VAPAAWAFVAFGVLQGVALARHGDDLDWSRPAAWVFALVLVVAVAVGLAVLRAAARADPARVIDLTDAPDPARGRATTGGRGRLGNDAGA
jgi:protein-S-isoprenylcysteine O-methyltransferase Ste14